MSIQMILFQLAKGMLVSIEIFALTLLFSLPLGLVVAFGRMAKNVVLRSVTKAYISIMRGTPLMLQLLIIYFGPSILFKVKIGPGYRFVAVILAFSINYAVDVCSTGSIPAASSNRSAIQLTHVSKSSLSGKSFLSMSWES